ncbi:MAG: alcohol dehydrogenase catalytic domain-containing protein [Solirubrobacterales bacterium]|nr:alcohol dehydrogenase catalytic domain-containing protein [Solirubrobacterales bacterium]
MKAIVLSDVETIQVEDIDEPAYGSDEVLIRVGAGGICGSDMHAYRGQHPFRKPPVVLGHEVAGEVVEIGSDVTRVRVGDRVAVEPQISCMNCSLCLSGMSNLCRSSRRPGHGWGGTFAELMSAPQRVVYPLGRDTPFELGALVEPAAVAMRAFRRGEVRIGDRVAVIGAGPIGGLIAHIAHRAHVGTLLVTDINPFNLGFINTIGIEQTANPNETDLTALADELTASEGFDVVFVTSTHLDGLNDAIGLARPGGRVIQVAIYGQSVVIDATLAVLREVEVRPSLTYSADDFRLTTELIRTGRLAAQEFITQRYSIWDAGQAFSDIAGGMDHVKVMLTP